MSDCYNSKSDILCEYFFSYKQKYLDGNGQDINNFVFPTEYYPRNDLINKIILTSERIINIITNSVIKASENTYVTAATQFINKRVYNVIYTPSTLPSILINIIENLENIELSQIIQLCIDTYEKYDTFPACLIIAIQQLNENIIEKSSSCQELSVKYLVHFGQSNFC